MPSPKNQHYFNWRKDGFTLTELLVAVGIVGILSSIALPNYSRSIQKARQADAANQISMIQNTIQSYREEYLDLPSGWDDLAKITPIPDCGGIAKGDEGFTDINTSNGCHYTLSLEKNNPVITISAEANNGKVEWNIEACINTEVGYSDLQKGNGVPLKSEGEGGDEDEDEGGLIAECNMDNVS